MLVLFEDLHWVDPTTAELLALLVARVRGLPVLLLATARPEFAPPWPERPRCWICRGSTGGRARRCCGELVGGKSLPEALGRDILAKTDGVPLFLEELTKNLLETGWLADTGAAYELARPLPALDVPDTLQGSLMARLDRLSGPKNVAQIGAVIGREFPYALIAAVADLPPADLARALAALERGGADPSARRAAGMPSTPSSTRWSATPPTRACCAAAARPCTAGSSRRSRARGVTSRSASRSCSRTIAPARG